MQFAFIIFGGNFYQLRNLRKLPNVLQNSSLTEQPFNVSLNIQAQ